MSYGKNGRSNDLEQVRLMLFPHLSATEGRRRIDDALAGAADPRRLERIEQLAREPELDAELLLRVRRR